MAQGPLCSAITKIFPETEAEIARQWLSAETTSRTAQPLTTAALRRADADVSILPSQNLPL